MILRAYLDRFLRERNSEALARALSALDGRFGSEAIDRLLGEFEDEFLPDRVEPIVAEASFALGCCT